MKSDDPTDDEATVAVDDPDATKLNRPASPNDPTVAVEDVDATKLERSSPPDLARRAVEDPDATKLDRSAPPDLATLADEDADATRVDRPAAPNDTTVAGDDPDATALNRPGSPTDPTKPASDATDKVPGEAAEQATESSPLAGESDDLTGLRLMDRYLIGEKLGSGGFGSVYRATDELKQAGGEDSEIAIKAMDAAQLGDKLGLLVQEVSRSHRVSHPNILRVYDIHVDRGLAFITMELLEGETLSDRIARQSLAESTGDSFLRLAEVDTVAKALCDALTHCHEQDLVHADVKPANIFLCANGVVKLLDLGISQIVGVRGKVMGYSPLYASPQQMSGDLADPQDDLFSVGAVLYQCLTGLHPFSGKSAQDAIAAHTAVDVSRMPRRYRKNVARALEFEREARVKSAAVLWHRISPAIRRRNMIIAAFAVAAVTGFLVSNQYGRDTGVRDTVSPANRAAAQAHYEEALASVPGDAGTARAGFLSTLQLNPHHKLAATALAGHVRRAEYTNPALFTEIWADFASAIEAAPTSDPLIDLAKELADELLLADPSALSRSQVLSEFRAPLCVLPIADYRVDELERMRSSLSIGC